MRRKQGREAWEAVSGDAGTSRAGGGATEDEWDIERAVENRLVQVMFTVPKERLRVVNAEVEKEEEGVAFGQEKSSMLYQDLGEYEKRPLPEPNFSGDGEKAALQEPDVGYDDHHEGVGEGHQEFPDNETELAFSERTVSMISSTTFHLAEAIRLERPRTRVLEMVESIESRSQSNSPVSSASR